jgi:uncharacterized membrane protein YoaT (DUF817 family)
MTRPPAYCPFYPGYFEPKMDILGRCTIIQDWFLHHFIFQFRVVCVTVSLTYGRSFCEYTGAVYVNLRMIFASCYCVWGCARV